MFVGSTSRSFVLLVLLLSATAARTGHAIDFECARALRLLGEVAFHINDPAIFEYLEHFPPARRPGFREALARAIVDEVQALSHGEEVALRRNLEGLNRTQIIGLLYRAGERFDRDGQEGLRNVLRTLLHAPTRFEDVPFPLASGLSASATANVQGALTAFRADPSAVLDHIHSRGSNNEFRLDTSGSHHFVIPGGMHTAAAFQRFLQREVDRVLASDADIRRQLNAFIDRLNRQRTLEEAARNAFVAAGGTLPGPRTQAQSLADFFAFFEGQRRPTPRPPHTPLLAYVDQLQEWGFDTSPMSLLPLRASFGTHIGIHASPNGVIHVQLPRSSYNSNAWENSRRTAVNGLVPVGGKTLFPRTWDDARIRRAVETVLSSADSTVVSQRNGAGGTNFMVLVNWVDGVRIAVAITGDQVVSAYPTWRQTAPATVAEAYRTYQNTYGTVVDRLMVFNGDNPLSHPLTPGHLRRIYLGQEEGLPYTAGELGRLRTVLNPFYWDHTAQERLRSEALYEATSEWLEAERLLGDIERQYVP